MDNLRIVELLEPLQQIEGSPPDICLFEARAFFDVPLDFGLPVNVSGTSRSPWSANSMTMQRVEVPSS